MSKETVLHICGVVLEALISPAARACGFPKLAAGGLVLGMDAGDGSMNEGVMAREAQKRGRSRLASGGAEDFVLALSDGAPLFIHPRECIDVIGRPHIDHHSGCRRRARCPYRLGLHSGEGLG